MLGSNKRILISLLFSGLMLISLLAYFLKNQQETYAERIISKAAENTNENLVSLFELVESSKIELTQFALNKPITNSTPDSLNAFFSQLIQDNEFLQGVIILSKEFNYSFLQDGQSWITTHNMAYNDTLVSWVRLDEKMETVSTWSNTYSYVLNDSVYQLIRKELNQSKANNLWFTAKSQLKNNPELLLTVFSLNNKDNDHVVASFLYSTSQLGKQFISALQYDNTLISLLTKNNGVVTPLRTTDSTKIELYSNLNDKIKNLVSDWEDRYQFQNHSYSFDWNQNVFWTHVVALPNQAGIIGYAVTIPDADLAKTEKKRKLLYVYLATFFFVLAIISFWMVKRKRFGNNGRMQETPSPFRDEEILSIIKRGESERVEFKSSLRWDYKQNITNKILEDVIMKTIAAFANAKGGILFIGVSDNMEILGLEPDFKTLKKQNVDYFEMHLRNLIIKQFGVAFANLFLHIQFPTLEGKNICVISVKPGSGPLFIKTKNKQGHPVEKFFVRSGNASQEVESLNNINEYIKNRFPV